MLTGNTKRQLSIWGPDSLHLNPGPVLPWANYSPSLSLGFLICKMGLSVSSAWWCFFFLSLFIYWERERERERESASRRGAERRRDRIPSRLHTVSTEPNVGLELTNCEIMTWVEVRCSTNWATQEPLNGQFSILRLSVPLVAFDKVNYSFLHNWFLALGIF